MQYAAVMSLAGELVDANDCDHETFKRLVPLCPECKSPVFYRQSQERTSIKGKPFVIPAHWSHFQINAEQAAECEARVAKYTVEERERIKSKARNQRLRWLQRGFWGIFKKYYQEPLRKRYDNRVDPFETDVIFGDLVDDYLELMSTFTVYDANAHSVSDRLIDGRLDNVNRVIGIMSYEEYDEEEFLNAESKKYYIRQAGGYYMYPEIQEHFIKNSSRAISLYQIKNYVHEVVEFIFSSRMRHIRLSLLKIVMIEYCQLLLTTNFQCPAFHVYDHEITFTDDYD